MTSIIYLLIGMVLGAAAVAVFYLLRKKEYEGRIQIANQRAQDAKEGLDRERENLSNLERLFEGLSSKVLKESRDEFIKQAEPKLGEQVRPLKDALERLDRAISDIEGKREEAYGGIKGMLKSVEAGQARLSIETSSLATALKNPAARGRWGELTLRRVAELSGMSAYCDFDEQFSVDGGDGKLRPDMVVRMPAGKTVVVDAKAPIDCYMKALEASDENSRQAHLLAHAQAVRDHIKRLSLKSYWAQFENSPDFVVLFIPGESFFSAALEADRKLIEDSWASKVLIATPTSLIALLRVVALGWNQERLAENAQKISEAGKSLYERLQNFAEHFSKVGGSLDRAVESFNKAVGSWEHKLVPGARTLKELGATREADAEVPSVDPVEHNSRSLQQ